MTSPLSMVQSWSFNPNISLSTSEQKVHRAKLYVNLNESVGMIQF